jgi:DNA-binding NarL/FixJ family response regulator
MKAGAAPNKAETNCQRSFLRYCLVRLPSGDRYLIKMGVERTPQTVRVLVVDDHRLLRQELRNILSFHREFTVVGEAVDGVQAYELAQELQPDVILMDVHMPHMNGIEATRRIKTTLPQVIIIGLSVNTSIAASAEMYAAGASGYLGKDTAPENLYRAIHAALTSPKEASA